MAVPDWPANVEARLKIKMTIRTGAIFLFLVMLLQPEAWAGAAGAEDYLARLQSTIAQTRAHLPALTQSAEHAAGEFLSGGNLWAAGRQPDFIAEACQRAGGLMAMSPLSGHVPARHDVILYAVPGAISDSDQKIFDDWRGRGATVVAFCSDAGLFQNKFPIDTVVNVAEMWAWTAEFAAACTRLGKMPVLYQSYGLPRGRERAAKYQGKKFHDDLKISPIAPGVLGKEYLDQIQGMLAKIQKTELPKINRAAEWRRKAKSSTTLFTGHMFPMHGQDPRVIGIGDFVRAPAWENKDLLGMRSPEFVFYLGYQFAPQKLLDQARAKGFKLVYTDVQPGEPVEASDNILYIAPAWPLADGCVTVPGYDVPILPASGVIQAGIYWAIASRAFPN